MSPSFPPQDSYHDKGDGLERAKTIPHHLWGSQSKKSACFKVPAYASAAGIVTYLVESAIHPLPHSWAHHDWLWRVWLIGEREWYSYLSDSMENSVLFGTWSPIKVIWVTCVFLISISCVCLCLIKFNRERQKSKPQGGNAIAPPCHWLFQHILINVIAILP